MDGPYTRYSRATLWLLQDGAVPMGGQSPDAQPSFVAEVRPFYISRSVITNEHYEVFRPDHARLPDEAPDDAPVVNVTWDDAAAYCAWYAEFTGKPFRLPTEIEWEYAARGEELGRLFCSEGRIDDFVRHAGNSDRGLPVVETRKANQRGLFDTLGTVWEWTSSAYKPYPVVPGDGREAVGLTGPRVLRGGSFRTLPAGIGCGVRRHEATSYKSDDLGFRIVRSL